MFCLQPKGGLDFAAELAAKIGVVPVKKQDSDDDNDEKVADGEWSDEGHQEPPQSPEVQEKQLYSSTTKSRSETSKSKEKKSHHHHHQHHHEKKDRSESHGEHKHKKRRGSKTSHSSHTSVDTRQSVPAEDGKKKNPAFLCTFLMFKLI